MRISIFKVKQREKDRLKKWGEEVERRKDEAIKTLIEENCIEESIRFFEISGDTYVVAVMVANAGQKIIPPNLTNKLNKKHIKLLKECLLSEVPLEKMYNLNVN